MRTGKPQGHRARAADASSESRPRAFPQRGRREVENRPHGVVELADAGETGGERDVAERQVGRLDQDPGGLGALCARQRQRVGADLGLQEAFELAGGVAERGRPARSRPRGRRCRRRSGASPWPPRRRGCSTRVIPATRRAGSACTPGSRHAAPRPRWGRTAHCGRTAGGPGSWAGSRSSSSARR